MQRSQHVHNKIVLAFILCLTLLLSACSTKNEQAQNPLNPEQPISITLWHYYSGHTKTKFDQLVTDFNNTVGVEKGIVVDAKSQGDIDQLEAAVFNAANKNIGAEPLPDIFAAYPDNAFRVSKFVDLVDFETYFSTEELATFQQDFLTSGRLVEDGPIQILPIAKSTEILFLNKTFWDTFAQETNTSTEQLATWEGLAKTAEAYYEWSGGKAFLGIDSLANFMLIASAQLEQALFIEQDGIVSFNFEKQTAKKLWDMYYVPFINGHFIKEGRFSSDDSKVGLNIAYVGSTASAVYFPTEVTLNQNEITKIENSTFPYPVFENGKQLAVQQGAGMAIINSDQTHEFAAAEFLKWYTAVEQNSQFAVSTAYFPVKNEALQAEQLLATLEIENIEATAALASSIKTTLTMLEDYELISYAAFEGSFDIRSVLDNHLATQIRKDLEALALVSNEAEKEQLRAELQSEQHFNAWYTAFNEDIQRYFK